MTIQSIMLNKDLTKLSDNTIKRRLELLKEKIHLNKFQLINLLRKQNVLLTESVLRAEKHERTVIALDEAVLKDSSVKPAVKRQATEEAMRLVKKAFVEADLLPSCSKPVDTIKPNKNGRRIPIRSQEPQDYLT